jgi:hypothetical protein
MLCISQCCPPQHQPPQSLHQQVSHGRKVQATLKLLRCSESCVCGRVAWHRVRNENQAEGRKTVTQKAGAQRRRHKARYSTSEPLPAEITQALAADLTKKTTTPTSSKRTGRTWGSFWSRSAMTRPRRPRRSTTFIATNCASS